MSRTNSKRAADRKLAALRAVDRHDFAAVSAEMLAALKAEGLVSLGGNLTDAGRNAMPYRIPSFRSTRRAFLR